MIDLTTRNEAALERAIQRARERNIVIPTFKQMRNPDLIPDTIKADLAEIGLWDLNGNLNYEWRAYDSSFAGQLEEEQDLFQIGVGGDRWFGGNIFSAGPFLTYSLRESNLVGNDYDRVQVGLRLRADW